MKKERGEMKEERCYRSDLDKVSVKNAAVASLLFHLSSLLSIIRFPFAPLAEIFRMHNQQTKGLPILFISLGVMVAMCAQDGAGVFAVQLAEPLETLVDVYVVDQKVNQAVNGNSNAHEQQPALGGGQANYIRKGAWNGKNQEEQVVFFKKTMLFMVWFVVVFVPNPQPAMHEVFVRRPGYKFHA
jgi:hypothetical protein